MCAAMSKNKPPAHTLLEKHMDELGLSYMPEYQFAMVLGRKWAADYMVHLKTLIEIEGGIWSRGRHTRGSGYEKDLEKYNTAAAMGYRVFRFSTGQVMDGSAKEWLKKWL